MEITPIVKTDFLVFAHDSMLSEMIGKLRQSESRSGLVFRNDKYLGVIERKKLLRARIDASNTKLAKYIHRTPILSEHADVIETAYLMHQSDADFLPVESRKEIIGVVDSLNVAMLGASLPECKACKISDLRIIKPPKLNKDDSLATALDIMYMKRIDQVPVFDGRNLYGIISYRDILQKYFNWSPKREFSTKMSKSVGRTTRGAEADKPSLANLPVSSFSTNDNIVSVGSNARLLDTLALMTKHNVSDAIVMDGENVKGILTLKSILRMIGSLKIPQNFNIKFIGLQDLKLKSYEKYNVTKIVSNQAFKLQRALHNQFSLVMHLKEYQKDGNRQKYAINLRVEFPGRIVTVSEDDWDIETAVRKTLDNAKNKLKKNFKGNVHQQRVFEV